jgi:carbamoyltransferase
MARLNILGINSVFHESSAAIIVDGKVVAACEEERFNRVKHGKRALPDNPDVLPGEAVRFCLDYAGLSAADIDQVAYSFAPELRRATFRPDWWAEPQNESTFLERLGQVGSAVDKLLGRRLRGKFKFVDHHLAHAASAYFPSGFDRSAILIIDGIGEAVCSTLASGDGTHIRTLEAKLFPHSLGFLWEDISDHLGFSRYDAAKVMGLAAYGDPKVFSREFAEVIRVTEDDYTVDQEAIGFQSAKSSRRQALFGNPRVAGAELLPRHADIAAGLQAATDAAVLALARRLEHLTGMERLCIAGGVALNCVTNTLVKESGLFSEVFIPSAPHDAGTAIGAALAVYYANGGVRPGRTDDTAYLGPQFAEREIVAAVRAAGLTEKRSKNPAREAAAMIADGNIVAWFQGRMEFGPRALGNRSLLGDPRRPDTREIFNRRVKHREEFRPFAPSVLAKHAHEWFEVGQDSLSNDYMLFACPAKPDRRDRIPAVLHCDGTARVQIVRRKANPRFHELLSCFHAQTGVPMVLNTSFNDNEPIVCTPAHAIATFCKTGIDALFMGNVYVTSQA